ncbi:MAG: hypothetical protein HDP34_01925 [Clostridia bacterium]|nr:hypothetical protein [Clostridia bacterium]
MFEFNKLCNEYEKLNSLERQVLLAEKSVKVLASLKELDLPFADPVETLAAFIVGSVVSDGVIDEMNYLGIYPSLKEAFGEEFDFATIKNAYKVSKDVKKAVAQYTKDLHSILSYVDEELGVDIISLCLLVTSIDGKISLKEKKYIKQLCS